jgi:hypothetical protein
MDHSKAPSTHTWVDGVTPHKIRQDGKTILHHHCVHCGRDFAQGLDGAGWQAVYIGVFKVELLAETVNEKWLTEECPGRTPPDDDVFRAMRRS